MSNGTTSVLLVDDDADVVWGVGRCLARAGFSIMTSGNGSEAVNLLASRSFDFVLTDIRMPEMNGLELTDWVRRNRPQTKIIIMTAFGSPAVRQLSYRKGAIQYLEKPLDPNLLIDILASIAQKESFSGSIDEIDILDYIQLLMLTGSCRGGLQKRCSRIALHGLRIGSPRHMWGTDRREGLLPMFGFFRRKLLEFALGRAEADHYRQAGGLFAYGSSKEERRS